MSRCGSSAEPGPGRVCPDIRREWVAGAFRCRRRMRGRSAPVGLPVTGTVAPARAAAARKPADASGLRRAPVPWDDGTYRPTVVVRRGTSQGSGTIIASVDGETLVLTAAHVVKAEGPIFVELHRYNLGMERLPATPGVWPRVITASLAAADTAADLAIVRIEKMTALPYVARFTHDNDEPPPNAMVTSIGIDLGLKLTHWSSRLVETVTFELNDSGSARPFLITEKIPEHGRSGGGPLPGQRRSRGRVRRAFRAGEREAHGGLRRAREHSPSARRSSIDRHDPPIGAADGPSQERAFPGGPDSGPAPSSSAVTPTRSVGGGTTCPVRALNDSRRGRAASRDAKQQQEKDDRQAPENRRIHRVVIQIKDQHQAQRDE